MKTILDVLDNIAEMIYRATFLICALFISATLNFLCTSVSMGMIQKLGVNHATYLIMGLFYLIVNFFNFKVYNFLKYDNVRKWLGLNF